MSCEEFVSAGMNMSRPEGFDVPLHPGVPQGLSVSDSTSGGKVIWWLEGFEQEDQLALDNLQLRRSGIGGAQGPRRDLAVYSVISEYLVDPLHLICVGSPLSGPPFRTRNVLQYNGRWGRECPRLRRKPSSLWSSSCMIVT